MSSFGDGYKICPWTDSTSEGVEDRRFSEVACRSIPPEWPPFSLAQLEQLIPLAMRVSNKMTFFNSR